MKIDYAVQLKTIDYGLLNKQNCVCSTFKVFQGLYSCPILNHAFDVWLAEKYFKPSWKSGQTITGPPRLVPPSLNWVAVQLGYLIFLNPYIGKATKVS